MRALVHVVVLAGVAEGWHAVGVSAHGRALAAGEAVAASAMLTGFAWLLGRTAGWLAEAAAHALAWRALGWRLPLGPFLAWLPGLSVLDLLAHALAHGSPGTGALAWLVGLHPEAAAAPSGFAAAFGGLGLLAVARIVLTADIQRRVLGVGWALPGVITGSLWLGSRLTVWWTADLMRGRSPF
jgi:hypothetical protein